MKRFPVLTLLGSCAAIVITACGTQVATVQTVQTVSPSKAPSSPATAPSKPAPLSHRQRAEADAAAIRASFVPPPGARRLTAAPGYAGGALKQPVQTPGTPDLVDDASWWLVPGQPQAVLAWERAHLPRRFAGAGSSTSYAGGVPTEWSDQFSLPAVPAVLESRQLIVQVVSAGANQTAIRVDAQVIWLPAKPAAERVPSGAKSVTLSMPPTALSGGKPPAPVTITNTAKLHTTISLADALPVFPPGVYSCPAYTGTVLELIFRSVSGRALAVLEANQTGCATVSFTVGGKSMPTLWDGASFVAQVLKVAGLNWS